MKKILTAAFAALSSLILLSGCGSYTSKNSVFYSMNTEAELVISDKFDSKKNKSFASLSDEVFTLLNELNLSLSISISSSPVSKFNAADAGEEVEIDKTSYEVLSIAKSVYELTDGYYNPAVYYSVQAYGFNEAYSADKPAEERLPDDGDIEKYRELSTHFGETQLYERDGSYFAAKPEATVEVGGEVLSLRVDLGGIGKGYAVDKVNALIDKYGFKFGNFSFGSSSRVCKSYYKGGGYTFASRNPRPDDKGTTYFSTSVENVCISTSGDYEQYFEYGGVRYCHIFDPTTGKPVQTGIMTATVIGGSAAEGDALTTALMAMGEERAVEFIRTNLSQLRVIFALDSGEGYKVYTNIPNGEITVTHPDYTLVNITEGGNVA